MKPTSNAALAALLIAITAGSSGAQSLYRRLLPAQGNEQDFGASIASAGDVDGDGLADVIVGIPVFPDLNQRLGKVHVRSGATGQVLRQFAGQVPGNFLGRHVSGVGDVDADGRGDYAYTLTEGLLGRVIVRSGRTNAILRELPLAASAYRLANVGDFDGDGRDDLGLAFSPQFTQGRFQIHSLATGTLLFQLDGPTQENFASSIGAAGDVDGDGRGDIFVGSSNFRTSPTAGGGGRVRVFSGATQQLIFEVRGESFGINGLGASTAAAGDVDGDGQDDLFIAWNRGVALFNSATGARVYEVPAVQVNTQIVDVCALGDVDNDGLADFAFTSYVYSGGEIPTQTSGFVRVVSGASGIVLGTRNAALGTEYREFGPSVVCVGDADGDGNAEFAIQGVGTNGVGLVDLFSFHHNSVFCAGLPNSTGAVGTLDLRGSPVVARDLAALDASRLPQGALALLLAARSQGPALPVGSGELCLAGPIGRFSGPGQIQVVSTAGTAGFTLPLQALPTPTGLLVATPGETWTFQAWHRDTVTGTGSATSNFTRGFELTFR